MTQPPPRPVPPDAVARLEAFGDAGGPPVPAVPAATVALLRESGRGLETYLLQRHARMPFAPGHVVFPGGRAEPGESLAACAVRETCEETAVRLDEDALVPWAHWITPEFEPRRYDTRFYVALLPRGARALDVSGETDGALWVTPADALARLAEGRWLMLPPTERVLAELSALADWPAVVAAAAGRAITPVLPRPERRDGGWWFSYPVEPS